MAATTAKKTLPWVDRTTTGIESGDDNSSDSLFNRLMGRGSAKAKEKEEEYGLQQRKHTSFMNGNEWDPACEDVLTWIRLHHSLLMLRLLLRLPLMALFHEERPMGFHQKLMGVHV
jgi:hypothetical protein